MKLMGHLMVFFNGWRGRGGGACRAYPQDLTSVLGVRSIIFGLRDEVNLSLFPYFEAALVNGFFP
jgi:hypothetical protein